MSAPPIIRPLLSAFQKTINLITRRLTTSLNPSRSIAEYEATVNAGTEEIAKDEIRRKLNAESRIQQGRVLFKTDLAIAELLKLRSINNLFVMIYDETLEDDEMPTDSGSLERLLFRIGDNCDWRIGIEKWLEMSGFDCDIETMMTNDPDLKQRQPKFRVSSNRYGPNHKFTSPELCTLFGHVIDTKFGWPIKLKGMDLDVYLNFTLNRVYANITLSPLCLSNRNVTLTGLTTLRATTCYAMLRKANIQTGDILVDPMAGSGAIPLESCDCYHHGESFAMTIGGELRRQTLKKFGINLQNFTANKVPRPPADCMRLDVTRLPFCDNSIDIFVSDLPFGQRHGSRQLNKRLYPKLMRELGRSARLTSGRAVLLTHDYKNMIDAYRANRDLWKEVSDDVVKVGNLRCHIYLYKRTDVPFGA